MAIPNALPQLEPSHGIRLMRGIAARENQQTGSLLTHESQFAGSGVMSSGVAYLTDYRTLKVDSARKEAEAYAISRLQEGAALKPFVIAITITPTNFIMLQNANRLHFVHSNPLDEYESSRPVPFYNDLNQGTGDNLVVNLRGLTREQLDQLEVVIGEGTKVGDDWNFIYESLEQRLQREGPVSSPEGDPRPSKEGE